MSYAVECECSRSIGVELWDAGRKIPCPDCGSTLTVPSSTALKEQSGDAHPLASPVQRAAIALENGEWPFSGTCQSCETEPATRQQRVEFTFLIERFFDHDGGVGLGPGGPLVVGSPTESKWGSLRFPLLFCSDCFAKFQRQKKAAAVAQVPGQVFTIILFVLVLAALLVLATILPFVGWPLAVLVFWRLLGWSFRKQANPTLLQFVLGLKWVGEAVEREDEYRLKAGANVRLSQPGVVRK